MPATNTVKDGVHTYARETVNLFHKVLMPIIDWDTA
jgi:hypothetical protein